MITCMVEIALDKKGKPVISESHIAARLRQSELDGIGVLSVHHQTSDCGIVSRFSYDHRDVEHGVCREFGWLLEMAHAPDLQHNSCVYDIFPGQVRLHLCGTNIPENPVYQHFSMELPKSEEISC